MEIRNPYKVDEECIVSFSGGRTSAFMLYKIIQAHNGKLPDYIHVVFANTGKEMPQTYQFIDDCSKNWDVKVHWLELYGVDKEGYKPVFGSRDWIFQYKETNSKDCSRKGEPFQVLIDHYKKLPNATNRFCTYLMKQRAIAWYEKVNYMDNATHVLGLRHDEPHRVHRVKGRKDKKDYICPLYDAKHTAKDVQDFWNASNFDLNLIYRNGHTVFGNCDMCFLKGKHQLKYMMKQKPELTDWWIEQEERTGKTFKYDISFQDLKDLNKDQKDLFTDIEQDESIDCFCHD